MRFLGLDRVARPEAASDEIATIRRITEALDRLPPERARYVAAFAFLLSRVAHADRDISAEETRAMEQVVMQRGGLPEEQAVLVVQMAKSQSILFGGTENFVVARAFEEMASREQKLALVDCLFGVAASDEGISAVESNEVRQIADELKLSHRDYIGVRGRYKDQLSVLRREEEDAEPDGPR
jgi:uncharacterized tellurite resistance protein B-like protein